MLGCCPKVSDTTYPLGNVLLLPILVVGNADSNVILGVSRRLGSPNLEVNHGTSEIIFLVAKYNWIEKGVQKIFSLRSS